MTRAAGVRDSAAIGGIALLVRLAVVIWAAPRFPPVMDGDFYHRVAQRIAAGLGYTWLWPDGAVTFAAHYPVGYPAMMGGMYALFGPHPGAAMALSAVLGSLAAVAVYRLAARAGSRRTALIAGLLAALHPGLVGYTPALMTEGVTASLLACGAWAMSGALEFLGPEPKSLRRAVFATAGAGVVLGAATLVRPQSLVLAPIFAWIAWGSAPLRFRALGASAALLAALLVCAPWTLRNCVRMKSCALVSVNGGWNLAIGAEPGGAGTWAPIKVPEACREVWDEAAKDACFGREALRSIAADPLGWAALAPKKLAATFNHGGTAGGWYLHTSNASAFGERARDALGASSTAVERSVLLLAILGALRRRFSSPRRLVAAAGLVGLSVLGAVFAVSAHAWVSYSVLALLSLIPRGGGEREPFVASAAGAVVIATLITHAIFFGAGRYALVVFPLLCGAAALAFERRRPGTSISARLC
ncbi:MAG: glycosyltransferase family 39 protein [Polyangiaceae bacterium]|nr:glycosyltransferase family 39 protein [Polyangiaceae bacterium]